MQYWLLKTEPGTWSWDDQVSAPRKTTVWDGVRNHQADNFMRQMRKGARCFFYHSGKQRQIVGVVEVVKGHEPDPSDQTGKGFGMVTVKAVEAAAAPVTLADIKAEPKLAEMVLVKHSRLSVQPVKVAEWRIICKMTGLEG